MCTVTLVPRPESMSGFVLTSNRDESVGRETLSPAWERFEGVRQYFPKDKQAGGTWLGVSEHSRCICLMNGAEKPHERKPEYRKSRGVVVKEFLAACRLRSYLNKYNFEGIEPFTMIIVEWHDGLCFQQLVWDGKNYKHEYIPITQHIWSSSPLYSEAMKKKRKQWFEEVSAEGYTAESLLKFHKSAGEGNKEYGLIIDRGFLKTQSISQVVNGSDGIHFSYQNLINKDTSEEYLTSLKQR
ncbi:NRDE family protein [Christiangramia sp. ASW11-125]|uniref:NRDE family protein n=1 Tax=Christiangramia sp. ASW11-125 TaxID=3400701 RepID=UPI003AAE07CA